MIRGIAFSPDSTRLAVGQSDNIVFVYRLGESWGEKKVICNKFPQSAAVTALIWLSTGAIIAGLADGKVRALHTKTNKSQSLYGADNLVVSLAANTRGTGFLSGHQDGSVVKYFIVEEPGEASGRLFQHSVPPFALAWLQGGIAAAGCDRKIAFYDGQVSPSFIGLFVLFLVSMYFHALFVLRDDKHVCSIIRAMKQSMSSWSLPVVQMARRWLSAVLIGCEFFRGAQDKVRGVKQPLKPLRIYIQ